MPGFPTLYELPVWHQHCRAHPCLWVPAAVIALCPWWSSSSLHCCLLWSCPIGFGGITLLVPLKCSFSAPYSWIAGFIYLQTDKTIKTIYLILNVVLFFTSFEIKKKKKTYFRLTLKTEWEKRKKDSTLGGFSLHAAFTNTQPRAPLTSGK